MRIRIVAALPRAGFMAIGLSFVAAPSMAQPGGDARETLAPLTIEDSALVPAIAGETEVSNRLNLAPKESPATVETLSSETMQRRGLATFTEAARTLPGVTGGNIPGSPASLSMRGFPRGNVNYLFDGMRAADSELVIRDFDTFNFERIEILKGPASVLHGDGGLAGTVNLVTKKPSVEGNSAEGLASVGRFNTLRAGIGGNRVLSDRVAVRADLSHRRSDGFIDDNDSRTTQLTTGVLFQATDCAPIVAEVQIHLHEVLLLAKRTQQPVEYGAIKIHLGQFPGPARDAITGAGAPLGQLLHDYGIGHLSRPSGFLRVECDDHIGGLFGLDEQPVLFGRRNTLYDATAEHRLAEIVEILPPA